MTAACERSTTSRTRRHRARVAFASISVLGLVSTVLGLNTQHATEATWNDSEHVQSLELSAISIDAPVIVSAVCSRPVLGLVLNQLEVTWTWSNPHGLNPADGEIVWILDGLEEARQPLPSTPGTYTTDFTDGLLAQLIQLLLGKRTEISARIEWSMSAESSWASEESDHFINLNVPPIVGSVTCPRNLR